MTPRTRDRATVVLVEDDASVRRSLTLLLDVEGFAVESFSSAKELLGGCNPPRPACMLLDVRLPGMSGVELYQALVADGRSLPVVFLTGHGPPELSEALRHGVVRMLEKPCDPDVLLEAIREAIAQDDRGR